MKQWCRSCGAAISRYADATETLCAPCGGDTWPTHLAMIDAIARAAGERPTTCKRGHDLDIYGKLATREGGRTTWVCAECKRQRDAGYARARRARAAGNAYLSNRDPGDEQP